MKSNGKNDISVFLALSIALLLASVFIISSAFAREPIVIVDSSHLVENSLGRCRPRPDFPTCPSAARAPFEATRIFARSLPPAPHTQLWPVDRTRRHAR